MSEKKTLQNRILSEMTEDYGNALERNFTSALKFLRVSKDGKVHIVIDKTKLTGKEMIQLYLIGKLYAKEGGLSQTASSANEELMEELGIIRGSVLPWTKELRDTNAIKSVGKGVHEIQLFVIEKFLRDLQKKLEGGTI